MQKLRDEIDGMIKKGQVSDPVTLKETQAMPYLQAVVKGVKCFLSLSTMGPYEKVVCARTPESKVRVCSRSLDPIDSIG